MELKVKNGYLLVESVTVAEVELSGDFQAGRIAVGPEQDLGVVVFFSKYQIFSPVYLLVAVEDVMAWIKPEAPAVEVPAEVVVDEPKND